MPGCSVHTLPLRIVHFMDGYWKENAKLRHTKCTSCLISLQ